MAFDFRKRANELAAQKAQQQQREIQKRDRNNEIAREIVQGILEQYAGRLGNQFASVQSNVATIHGPTGGTLTITVLDENSFVVKETGSTGGFREAQLHDKLQETQLDKTDVMDVVIGWFDEAGL